MFAIVGGTRHYYRLEGRDGAPALVLSHSLGLDHGMWEPQVRDWLPHFRLLRYDTRGHGATDLTPGDYSIEQLGQDVLAIADAAGVREFAFCGLSLGGMIGQWLALNAPERVTGLVLANTSSRLTDPAGMEARRKAVVDGGMPAIVDMVMGRFFSPAVLQADPPAVAWARRTLLATNPGGYAGCCAAIRDMNQTPALSAIRTRTLTVAGERDVSLPPDPHSTTLQRQIPNARLVSLPAAHLSNLERPRSFSVQVLDFLRPRPDGSVEHGTSVRRTVLGDAHVDRKAAEETGFTREFQELITKFAWGTVWARPGLDLRTRRLLALTALAALGRWEEFRMHVQTGLAADLEPCDLKEALLQLAIYAGVPAANTAFQIAVEEGAARGERRSDGKGGGDVWAS